ncbi:MAG: Flp pilus assembly complex ATPase component TadA [Magnetococcales bacterium]|nr:Flp pilus assembly complex ATPase component TadA [Magnetococcales bacterium]
MMQTEPVLYFQIQSAGGKTREYPKPRKDAYVVGRQSATGSQLCDVFLDDAYASRRHCRIYCEPGGHWYVEDLRSANGTRFNGAPMKQPELFTENDWVQIGTTRLSFSVQSKLGRDRAAQAIPTTHAPPPQDEEATLVMSAPDQKAAPSLDNDATVVAPSMSTVHEVALDADDATVMTVPEPASNPVKRGSMIATLAEEEVEETAAVTVMATQVETEAAPQEESASEAATEATTTSRQRFSQAQEDAIQVALRSDLIQEFLHANYLDRAQVIRLLEESQSNGQTFFRTLARDRSVKFCDAIFRTIGQRFGWPLISDAETLAAEWLAVDWLPINLAGDKGLLSLRSENPDRVRFGTIDPFDVLTQDWVVRCARKPTDMVLIHPDIFFPTLRRLKEAPAKEEDAAGVTVIDIDPEEERMIREQIGSVDIPRIVNYFLYRAHVQAASDIHIEPTEESMVVRLRVDGILHEEITLPMTFHAEAISRLKILSGMDVAEKRRPQDGRISTRIGGDPIDIRVSSFPTVFGEKFVLRLLDKNALRPSIDSLGLVDRDLRLLKEKLGAPYGLVMIAGPTGSGKTTTLYSCLGAIDKNRKNVLTVEDPVEYRLAGVHQMQVNHRIGLTFASGLRTILRQDPDVIMVGEIRDKETAEMAVQASLTGHIVFSTIHTNDAVGVVGRLLDMGMEPFLVATSLSLVIAQRLLRMVCKHCRTMVSGAHILEKLESEGVGPQRLQSLGIDIDPDLDYTQGTGCSHCRDSGYQGRRAVFEVFEITDAIRAQIMLPNMTTADLKELSRQAGMTNLISHGVKLVEDEVTTFEEVIRVLGEEM